MKNKYKLVDLFAGAGGLSLGFKQTNRCDIKLVFEKSKFAQQTYRRNFSDVEIMGDVCGADYKDILDRYGKIDIVIGGPPCQGFSNANRQKNHPINSNNLLIKEYVRAIRELHPDCFLLENVSMLKSDVHRFFLSRRDFSFVRSNSIKTEPTNILLLEKEFVFKGVLSVIKKKGVLSDCLWTNSDYKDLNRIVRLFNNNTKLKSTLIKNKKRLIKISSNYKTSSNSSINKRNREAFLAIKKYYEGKMDLERLKKSIYPAFTIQRMLNSVNEIYDNDIIVTKYSSKNGVVAQVLSYSVLDYIKAAFNDSYIIGSDVLCTANFGVPQKRKRFIMVGIKKAFGIEIVFPKGITEKSRHNTVRDAIFDLENISPVKNVLEDNGVLLSEMPQLSCLAMILRDSRFLFNHIIPNTSPMALERFEFLKQGENFHSLDDSLKVTYTNSSKTQNTVYLRLDYDKPCETVVNVRKSMWVHPTKNRAISVREAARLQSFPDSFIFEGPKDSQYQQVGNAVPPIFANKLAIWVITMLDKKDGQK